MRPVRFENAPATVATVLAELHRSAASRYQHRLHAVLLVARGVTCPEAARLLCDSPGALLKWVRDFKRQGPAGLVERRRPGRPALLTSDQVQAVKRALRRTPRECGLEAGRWDGKTLSAWMEKHLEVQLGERQCQRRFLQGRP